MKILAVSYHGRGGEPLNLGRLTFYEGKGQFEYSDEAIASNIALSPYHLGLRKGLIQAPPGPFHGITMLMPWQSNFQSPQKLSAV